MTEPSPILVICSDLSNSVTDGTLIDEMVGALSARGLDVTVLDMTPAMPPRTAVWEGVRLVPSGGNLPLVPRPLNRAVGIARGAWWALHQRDAFSRTLYFSPAFLSGIVPAVLRLRRLTGKTVYVLWDFFPIHQVQIGRLSGRFAAPLKLLEGIATKPADTVLVMTPRNEQFLREYFPTVIGDKKVGHLLPWGGDGLVDPKRPRRDEFTVVFGGQLVEGRGVETLLQACRILRDRGRPVNCEIFGSGPQEHRLRQLQNSLDLSTVKFRGRVPRSDYLDEISRCHVGVAVTVPGVTIPSFPSKTIDYARAGLAVVTCLEETSDAGAIIEGRGVGISVAAGHPEALASALDGLHHQWAAGRLENTAQRARDWYNEGLSASSAAQTVLEA